MGNMSISKTPFPVSDRQPLKIHAGWHVEIYTLREKDPDQVSPDDEDTWLFDFLQDLMYLHFDETYGLDLGWYPEGDRVKPLNFNWWNTGVLKSYILLRREI